MSNPHPKGKRAGQGSGPRRLRGVILDVSGVAELLDCSEGMVRTRAARGLLPSKRWGSRLIFLRQEILEYLATLPGTTVEEARRNQQRRAGDRA
jgi:hypothetical protein